MNKTGRFMNKRSARFTWTDWLLLTAIIGLSAYLLVQLLGLVIETWRHWPQPGMQVEQQHIVQVSNDAIATATSINCLLYLPPDYTRHIKWPLVVYLHGSGSRGHDPNLVRREGPAGLVEQGKIFNFILLSPQCPPNSCWDPEIIIGLIEHISSSLSVDRDRVYLTGYSMGGNGTWAAASYDPDRFAAIAPLCGGGNVSQAKRLTNIPVWAFHGAKDNVIPLKVNETMVNFVRESGGRVEFTVYPDRGHDICGITYQNRQIYEWLLAQRRSQPPSQMR